MKFLDQAKIFARSGDGGGGAVSFRREKFIEYGGPDGGDGGRGGDVIVECVDALNTLIDFRYQQHFKARTGNGGAGAQRSGKAGAPVVLRVPRGTQILDETGDHVVADMTTVGERVALLVGGIGGRGNARFKTSVNRAPRHAQPGEPGQEAWFWLRLKLIADAGLVGLPNAGKSTMLSTVSRARPKVADYPFTTLHPALGVVYHGGEEFVLADIPGLIEGAHAGRGLGDRFLGHVERCAVLLHLIDATATPDEVCAAYTTITDELAAYGATLGEKPVILVLTKIDALTDPDLQIRVDALRSVTADPVIAVSAVAGRNIDRLLAATHRHIAERADTPDTTADDTGPAATVEPAEPVQ